MKKIVLFTISIILLSSCIQDYPNEYIKEVDTICNCMRVSLLKHGNLNEHTKFLVEDDEYRNNCILDAIINEVNTKSPEFTNAINDLCPELQETHKRYIDGV